MKNISRTQPFRRFTYITAHSPTLPLLHLCHSSLSNPSFASPVSQALHLRQMASRPCVVFPLFDGTSIRTIGKMCYNDLLRYLDYPGTNILDKKNATNFSHTLSAATNTGVCLQYTERSTYHATTLNKRPK